MRLTTLALLAAMAFTPAVPVHANTMVPEARLRDALLKHFAQDNLIPIFLARPHEVGDVLEPSGAKFASRKDCFPALTLGKPEKTDSVKTLVLNANAEGNFGIALKRITDIFGKAGVSNSSRMTLTFLDQTYVGATTLDLQRAYAPAKCAQIQPLVRGLSVEGAQLPKPVFIVLQEIFYARKKLVVEFDQSAGLEAAAKDASSAAVSLGLRAELKAGAEQSKQLIIESMQPVPVAARIAFIPRPITSVTLGGNGTANIKGYLWRATPDNPGSADQEAMATMIRAIDTATKGAANPLLIE